MTQFRHGGHIRELAERSGLSEREVLDFSANINPLGPPEWLRSVVSAQLEHVDQYPDPDCGKLKQSLAKRYGRSPREIIAGNGSTELIYLIPQASEKSRAIIVCPAYVDYEVACSSSGLEIDRLYLKEERNFLLNIEELGSRLKGNELVFLGHPNNPTATPLPYEQTRDLILGSPDTIFVIDEAFLDLCPDLAGFTGLKADNLVTLISMTKSFAIPGLRLGVALAGEAMAEKVSSLQQPWSVNSLAQAVGERAANDLEYLRESRAYLSQLREPLIEGLSRFPEFKVFPSTTNFILVKLTGGGLDGGSLAQKALSRGISIRDCSNFAGLDNSFIRIAVRTEEENQALISTFARILRRPAAAVKRKQPAIMFQGVSSNAGKSVLTAGLCRVLLEDGYKVAPFKAQNMSLNSFVTQDGKEMGRAQVVQAQASGLAPDVRMNPILLKPSSDTGSQVIVMGEPIGNMTVGQYVDYKNQAFEKAVCAYDSLSSQFDVMVLEGAGSPAEVNLKKHDIVNMKMARHADAATLLAGDIDRGGLFASFIGVMETLAQWERRLIAGFVINRFRGDSSLLKEALYYTEAHTGKPILGLIPYINGLGLPEEDSVSFKAGPTTSFGPGDSANPGDIVEIALIDLPHISNFTDIDCFGVHDDIKLRVVKRASDMGNPDVIIIPGSKNVISDLKYLLNNGLGAAIHELRMNNRTEIVGICGGFQMLGRSIMDPLGIESADPYIEGLGLLDCSTVMAKTKRLTLARGLHIASGHEALGYEIHHGVTERSGLEPALDLGEGVFDGAVSEDGLVWGCYMHGLFDSDRFRLWFINRVRKRKGLDEKVDSGQRYDLGPAFQRLAQVMREGLNIKEIYRLAGL